MLFRSGRNSKKQGYVSWINGDGKEIASFQAKDAVTYLNCDNTGTVIGCNKTYYGFKIGGRAFWEYTATKDMIDVLLMENVNNVLFVTNDTAVILNMDSVSQDTTVKEQREDIQNTEKVIRKQQEDEQKEGEEGEQEQNTENEQNNETENNQNEQYNKNNTVNGENNDEKQNSQTEQNNTEQSENEQSETKQENTTEQNNEDNQNKQNQQNNQNQQSEVKQNSTQ